ncbi:MAG: hypothetical protein U0414_39915 [Polyangiaceae bacterium]
MGTKRAKTTEISHRSTERSVKAKVLGADTSATTRATGAQRRVARAAASPSRPPPPDRDATGSQLDAPTAQRRSGATESEGASPKTQVFEREAWPPRRDAGGDADAAAAWVAFARAMGRKDPSGG